MPYNTTLMKNALNIYPHIHTAERKHILLAGGEDCQIVVELGE